jgi:hypothetical protein
MSIPVHVRLVELREDADDDDGDTRVGQRVSGYGDDNLGREVLMPLNLLERAPHGPSPVGAHRSGRRKELGWTSS